MRRLLSPPVFPGDQDKTRNAAILNTLGWSTILIIIVLLVIRNLHGQDVNQAEVNLILSVAANLIAVVIYISRRGYVKSAAVLFVATAWSGLTYLTWVADGIHDVAFFGYIIPIMMAGLLLGWQGAVGFIFVSVLSGWALAYAEANQLFIPTLDQPLSFASDMTAVFTLTGILIYLTLSNLQTALSEARALATQLAVSNDDLTALRVDLEHRVDMRTSELTKRASQLEAVSSVARAIASVQDLNSLLPDITNLVSAQFGFYHVGIFLLDESREYAVLRASNSEGGRRMLSRGHRLQTNRNSIVGYAITSGEARIALDVGSDATYFDNPDLPETRSEMALPLRVGGRVIGVLDVQSTQTGAFAGEDLSVLATLADQVTIAIENARLFGEARSALAESKATFEKYTKQTWSRFASQARHTGFLFDGKQVTPLQPARGNENHESTAIGADATSTRADDSMGVPIRLRGQTIGVLQVRSRRGARDWTQDEVTLLEAAAERAALALENARLVESAQRRASRERAIGEISARIGAYSTADSILQTAVEELGRKFGGATQVVLTLETEDS